MVAAAAMPHTTIIEELAIKVRTGDRAAFEELMPYFTRWIHKSIAHWRLPGVTMDDLWQVAWLGLWEASRSYCDGMEFQPWAMMIMRRRLRDFVRATFRVKHQAMVHALSLDAEDWTKSRMGLMLSSHVGPEEHFIDEEIALAKEIALFDRLSKFEVKVMRQMLDGRPLSEAAAYLGVSYKSYENAVQRIRNKARRLWEAS